MINNKIENLLEKKKFTDAKLFLRKNKNKFSYGERCFYLGLIHQLNGEDKEAIALYLEALSHNPIYFAAAQNLVLLLSPDLSQRERINSLINVFDTGNARKLFLIAAKASKSLTYIDHDMSDLCTLTMCELEALSVLKLLNKEYEDSVIIFERIRNIKNLSISDISNFAVALNKLKRHDEACLILKSAVETAPESWKLLLNLSTSFIGLKDYEKGLEVALQAYRLHKSTDVKVNIARCYQGLELYETAVEYIDKISMDQMSSNSLQIKADIYSALKDYDAAEELYRNSYELDGDNKTPMWNLALMQLKTGNFNAGWNNYHYGHHSASGRGDIPFPTSTAWDGRDRDIDIQVWGEQGVGDEVMFAQLMNYLPTTVKPITYVTNSRVKKMMDIFWSGRMSVTFVDSQPADTSTQTRNIMVGDIPKFVFDEFQNDKQKTPYLRKITNNAERTIGFCWRGGTEPKKIETRSIPLGVFVKVFLARNCKENYLPLQYNMTRVEQAFLAKHLSSSVVIREYDRRDNLSAWAAEIASCDVVVSIDNSSVHFAGAMGIETHCLLPPRAEWRWGLNGKRTHWYESVNLYRDATTLSNNHLGDLIANILGG